MHEQPVKEVAMRNGAVIVRLTGELDLYNAEAVREALFAAVANADRLVVDMSDVSFVDSTALGILIEARGRLENRSAFFLAAPGLETRRALEVSGLDRHFNVQASVEAALGADV